jgi:nuclear migration protein JNM1
MCTKRRTHFILLAPWYVSPISFFACSQLFQNADSSDDEALPSRTVKQRSEPGNREELDSSNLIASEEAAKKFERAEKRRRMYLIFLFQSVSRRS